MLPKTTRVYIPCNRIHHKLQAGKMLCHAVTMFDCGWKEHVNASEQTLSRVESPPCTSIMPTRYFSTTVAFSRQSSRLRRRMCVIKVTLLSILLLFSPSKKQNINQQGAARIPGIKVCASDPAPRGLCGQTTLFHRGERERRAEDGEIWKIATNTHQFPFLPLLLLLQCGRVW